jgi:hypothetical protein
MAELPGYFSEGCEHLRQLLDEMSEFFNGELNSDDPIHFCPGCHATREEAINAAVALLTRLLFSCGSVQAYVVTRWLKLLPSTQWFTRCTLFHRFLPQMLGKMSFVEENVRQDDKGKGKGKKDGKAGKPGPAAAGGGVADPMQIEIGKRLVKAREVMQMNTTPFLLSVSMMLLSLFEPFMYLCFRICDMTVNKSSTFSCQLDNSHRPTVVFNHSAQGAAKVVAHGVDLSGAPRLASMDSMF